MARIIVLDAGPLGLASKPRGKAEADRCRRWIYDIVAGGARVVVPEIADYEVRRELIRVGATTGVDRLQQLEATLDYDPITTAAMRHAAMLWAQVRRDGIPTADKHALDGDCILAAQAAILAGHSEHFAGYAEPLTGPADLVTIATTNVGHLERFSEVKAQTWESIVPDSPVTPMGRNLWRLGTELSELIGKDVEITVASRHAALGESKTSPRISCPVFAQKDRLLIAFPESTTSMVVVPIPDNASVYRHDVDEDVTEYAIILEQDSLAGQVALSILKSRGETFE